MPITISFAAPLWELARCRRRVPGARLFRPPYGRLTPGLWWTARRLGLPVVTWSLGNRDWECGRRPTRRRTAGQYWRRPARGTS